MQHTHWRADHPPQQTDAQIRQFLSYGWSIRRAAGTAHVSIPAAYHRMAQYGGVRGIRRHGLFQVRTGREVARLLGVSHVQVSQWIRCGLFQSQDGQTGKIHRNMGLHSRRRANNRHWLIPDQALLVFLHNYQTWMLWHPDQICDPDWRAYAQDLRPHAGREWLTTEDVATRLDYTPEHVRRLLRAGSIPALRRGKIWYVWADDLIGLIGLPDQTTPPLDA